MLKKEVSHLHRQINEEQLKYKRDTQSLADSKKYLQLELNNRYSEVQKLNSALDEKTQALKKIETQLSNVFFIKSYIFICLINFFRSVVIILQLYQVLLNVLKRLKLIY